MACGLASSGWIAWAIRTIWDVKWSTAFPYIFWLYCGIGLIKAGLTLCLSDACEANAAAQPEMATQSEATTLLGGQREEQRRRSSIVKQTVHVLERVGEPLKTSMTSESKIILVKLCVLFFFNAFASGMLPVTLMSMYTNWRVSVDCFLQLCECGN
jgi:hypothetical protein